MGTGGAWSAPQPITYDALDHRSPNVFYNAQGQPIILWLAGETLRLLNLVTGAQADLSLDAGLGAVNEVRAVQTAAGDIAAVLRSQGSQHDLWVAYYDRQYGLWGVPRPLTDGPALEREPAVALDAAGQLRVAYAVTAIEALPVTVPLPDGSSVPGTATVEGQTDLDVLRYHFDRNLTLPPDGLIVSADASATAGTTSGVTLSVAVTNTGDLPLAGVAVSFYDGDPDTGGVLIEKVTGSAALVAGASRTLVAAYQQPQNTGIKTFFAVVEAADQAVESSGTDNRASKRAFGPDLALESVRVSPDLQNVVNLTAQVRNIGTTAALSTTLDLRLAEITGTLLARFAVPVLQTGETFTLTTPWDHGALPLGRQALWVVANEDDFDEVNTVNNRMPALLTVGPNLALDRYNTQSGDLAGATVPVTVTVFNRGTEAGTITVAFYRDWPLLGGTEIVSRTVVGLAAGRGVQVQADLPGPLGCGLFAIAEAANGEVDSADNVVALAFPKDCSLRQFLPMLLRH